MSIIERIYERILKEAEELSGEELFAKISARLERAAKENLAIYKTSTSAYGDVIVLYKPNSLLNPLQDLLVKSTDASTGRPVSRVFLMSTAKDAAYASIVGMITIDSSAKIKDLGPCDDSAKVGFVAAKEGYGPLLYDLAISFSPTGKIMSDREAVSDYALGVYKGMHKRSDVVKKPFVNKNDKPEKKTQKRIEYGMDPQDDSRDCDVWYPSNPEREPLDYSFSKSTSVNTSRLESSHQTVVNALKDFLQALPSMPSKSNYKHSNQPAGQFFAEIMDTAASDFFSDEYGKVPSGMTGGRYR